MTNVTYRAGMVGAGQICELHVAAVRKLAAASEPIVELVGVTDTDRMRARTNAEKWRTTAYADLDALVAAGCNVIHVLTPPASHAEVAIAATNASGVSAIAHMPAYRWTSGTGVDTTGSPADKYSRSLSGLTNGIRASMRYGIMPTSKPLQ